MNRQGMTIVYHTFGGTLQSDVVCLICGSESQKLDPILGEYHVIMACMSSSCIVDCSLDIPEQFICRRKGDKTPNCTLQG